MSDLTNNNHWLLEVLYSANKTDIENQSISTRSNENYIDNINYYPGNIKDNKS